MRQKNWNILTLSGMIISVILGIVLRIDVFITIMGFGFGGTMILVFHNFIGSQRDYDNETKRLQSENKYRKTVICSNCGTSHDFTPSHGVCMMEFLQDKKCTNCKCELKDTKQQIPNEVKHE